MRTMSQRCLRSLLLLALVGTTSCSPGADALPDNVARSEVAAALQRYMVAARAVDPQAIAGFFTPAGILFEPGIFPIQGPDSIRAFVASFPGVRVDSAVSLPDTIEVFGSTALIWGSYFERLAFPGQPVSEQHGRFVIEWLRQPDGQWLIHRYFRVPLPAQAPPATP